MNTKFCTCWAADGPMTVIEVPTPPPLPATSHSRWDARCSSNAWGQPAGRTSLCVERVYGIISAFYIEWQRRVCWLRGNFHHAVYTLFKYQPSLHPPWSRIHITSAILHVLVTAISVCSNMGLFKLFWMRRRVICQEFWWWNTVESSNWKSELNKRSRLLWKLALTWQINKQANVYS